MMNGVGATIAVLAASDTFLTLPTEIGCALLLLSAAKYLIFMTVAVGCGARHTLDLN